MPQKNKAISEDLREKKTILKPQIFYHSNSPLSKKSILYLKYTKTSEIHCLHTFVQILLENVRQSTEI